MSKPLLALPRLSRIRCPSTVKSTVDTHASLVTSQAVINGSAQAVHLESKGHGRRGYHEPHGYSPTRRFVFPVGAIRLGYHSKEPEEASCHKLYSVTQWHLPLKLSADDVLFCRASQLLGFARNRTSFDQRESQPSMVHVLQVACIFCALCLVLERET